MQKLYDPGAPKKSTNLTINSDLLAQSRALNVNLSATLESALTQLIAHAKADQWKTDNAQAIKCYNEFVDEHGCFGDEHRVF